LADADTLDTALITAVSNIVSTKGNPSKNPSGYSSSGKLDTQIPSLLSAGANPDCRDDRGRPALVAALDGSVAGPEILRQLLAAGASPDLATISTGRPTTQIPFQITFQQSHFLSQNWLKHLSINYKVASITFYKVASITYKARSTKSPPYLQSIIQDYIFRAQLFVLLLATLSVSAAPKLLQVRRLSV